MKYVINITISCIVITYFFGAQSAFAVTSVTNHDVPVGVFSSAIDPYGSGYDRYDDFASNSILSQPYQTTYLYESTSPDGGYDVAVQPSAPTAGCTRQINSFSVSVTNVSNTNDSSAGNLIGLSTDNLASGDTATTLSSNLFAAFPGSGVATLPIGTTDTFTITFNTPVEYSSNVWGFIAFEDGSVAAPDTGASRLFNFIRFNVLDTCVTSDPASTSATTPNSILPKTGAYRESSDLLLYSILLIFTGSLISHFSRKRQLLKNMYPN